jgi:hypothetical protein
LKVLAEATCHTDLTLQRVTPGYKKEAIPMAAKYSKPHVNTLLRIIERDAAATRKETRALWTAYNLGRCNFEFNQEQFDALGDLDTYTDRVVVALKKLKAAAR